MTERSIACAIVCQATRKLTPCRVTLRHNVESKSAVEFAEDARLWAYSELISCGTEITEQSSTRAYVCQATLKTDPVSRDTLPACGVQVSRGICITGAPMGLLGADQLWYRNDRAVKHSRNCLSNDIEN